MIALPIIASEQEGIIAQQIAIISEEKELAVSAAIAIKETLVDLVEPIKELITAIS